MTDQVSDYYFFLKENRKRSNICKGLNELFNKINTFTINQFLKHPLIFLIHLAVCLSLYNVFVSTEASRCQGKIYMAVAT